MLGFLHKRMLGECHPQIIDLLPLAIGQGVTGVFHDKALYAYSDQVSYNRQLYDRSLYNYVHMYNRLPQVLIDAASAKEFQTKLTHIVKLEAMRGQENWRQAFEWSRGEWLFG